MSPNVANQRTERTVIGTGSNTRRIITGTTLEECAAEVAEFLDSPDAKRLESVYTRRA